MQNTIILKVINRELLETEVKTTAPTEYQRKAVRVDFLIGRGEETRRYKNECLLNGTLSVLVPFEDYDRYPIGAVFNVIPQ